MITNTTKGFKPAGAGRKWNWPVLQSEWVKWPLSKTLKEFCLVHDLPLDTATKHLKRQARVRAVVLAEERSLDERIELFINILVTQLLDQPLSAAQASAILPRLLALRESRAETVWRERADAALERFGNEWCGVMRDMRARGLIPAEGVEPFVRETHELLCRLAEALGLPGWGRGGKAPSAAPGTEALVAPEAGGASLPMAEGAPIDPGASVCDLLPTAGQAGDGPSE